MDVAKFDADTDPTCVRCKIHEETKMHIFQCRSKHALHTHTDAVGKFRQALKRVDTAPAIMAALVRLFDFGLKGYYDRTFKDVFMTDELRELTLKTMGLQIVVGIENFQQGYLSIRTGILFKTYISKSLILTIPTQAGLVPLSEPYGHIQIPCGRNDTR